MVHEVRGYEELDGGLGREVFFRPHRYSAADLLPLDSKVTVMVDGEAHDCALHDISENGVAFEWPKGKRVIVGDRLERISVLFGRHEAYRGEARVGSVRERSDARIVGVAFGEVLLNVDEVLHLRSISAWVSAPKGPAWRTPGNDRFKALVSELSLFFEDQEQELARLEASLPWQVLHGDGPSSPARVALIERLRATFVVEVVRATEEIDQAVRSASPTQVPALRHYSGRHLQHFFMQSPGMHRSATKPFGYPGDYEVMRFIYERPFEGATLFAKAVSLSFHASRSCLAVRTRKDLVKRKLREIIEAKRGLLRILSVAAGPAQELVELLSELESIDAPIEIVLFDQDKGALSYAYRRLKPVIDARWAGQVKITYLHDSIKRLLRDADLFKAFGPFDAIYSNGLLDYFKTTTAVVLTRNLFINLAPGGVALIANMVPENPSRWYMEHHLDWYLNYRSRQELLEIGSLAAPKACVKILEEESGVNPFFQLTR